MSAPIAIIAPGKVRVSAAGVASFNRAWPCSSLRSSRAYWFEFDSTGDLVDTDCPESDDGPAASAMADDCRAFLREGVRPEWIPESTMTRARLETLGRDVMARSSDVPPALCAAADWLEQAYGDSVPAPVLVAIGAALERSR